MANPSRIAQRSGPTGQLDRIRRLPAGNICLAFVIVQTGCIIGALLFATEFKYLSPANIAVMLKAIPILGVIALGVGILMVAGEYELSVGSTYAFTAIVLCLMVEAGAPTPLAALAAIALGIGISVLNGLITLRFALPSFIVTMGAMLFWKGMILYVDGAQGIKFKWSEDFRAVVAGRFGPVEMIFVWFVVLTALFHTVMRYHRFGNHLLATGGNRIAAIANGIRPDRVKLAAFAAAGGMAAIGGIIAALRVASATPTQGGGMELQAIAASVIGGLALTGGRGSMLGVFLGAALIYTIQDVLLLLRAPGFYLDIFVGLLIILAAIANQAFRKEA